MKSNPAEGIREAAQRPALLSYVRERRCVLFVGAGLSRAAGYPGWRELMEIIVAKIKPAAGDSAHKELTALLKHRPRSAPATLVCRLTPWSSCTTGAPWDSSLTSRMSPLGIARRAAPAACLGACSGKSSDSQMISQCAGPRSGRRAAEASAGPPNGRFA